MTHQRGTGRSRMVSTHIFFARYKVIQPNRIFSDKTNLIPPLMAVTFIDTLKHHVKAILKSFGLELRRIPLTTNPAPLFDDPLEVIRKINSHKHAALKCPLNQCVAFNGMSFSNLGWHPFVQTAKEYIETGVRRYEGSHLEKYYTYWQPKNARDALIGATFGPVILEKQPSYIKHLPWSLRTIEERAAYMRRIIEIENAAFGNKLLTPNDGYGLHGPVSNEKGKLEYERILDVVDSIKKWGFDRWRGDITVEVLKRGSQFRYVITHGHHRTAAMAALGHDFIPATPEILIEDLYVDHWPSVYQKAWTREEALAYFNHLFDFNSLSWAKGHNLQ